MPAGILKPFAVGGMGVVMNASFHLRQLQRVKVNRGAVSGSPIRKARLFMSEKARGKWRVRRAQAAPLWSRGSFSR
jgi:hypothetical protein